MFTFYMFTSKGGSEGMEKAGKECVGISIVLVQFSSQCQKPTRLALTLTFHFIEFHHSHRHP